MGIKVRKMALILLSVSILLSGTACNLKRRKTVNVDKFINNAYQETHVTEWTEPVPEGMEIQYVCVRKQRADDSSDLNDEYFEYDDHGRQTAYMDVWDNGSYRVEVDYNSDGTVSATRTKHEGSQATPFRDIDRTFTYDEMGRIVREEAKETSHNGRVSSTSHEFLYDEKGCLIATKEDNDADWSPYAEWSGSGYDEESFSHKEYHVEFTQSSALFSSSFEPYSIVTYYYDEDGLLVAVSKNGTCKKAQYTDGVLTGWKREWGNSYSLYDIEGNFLAEYSESGELMTKYEYNEHGDRIRTQSWENGKLTDDTIWEYTYDEQGKVIQGTTKFWSLKTKDDGTTEEHAFTSSDQYTYDEHGLLTIDEHRIDGEFTEITVYDYKAVLVPSGTKVPSVVSDPEENPSTDTPSTASSSESETGASETSKILKIGPEGLITRDLTAFHLNKETKEDEFELTSIGATRYKYEKLVVVEDEFAYLQESIDKIQNQYFDDMLSRYEATCETLQTDPSIYNDLGEPIPSYIIWSWQNRVDSLVTSFQISTNYGSLEWDTYNLSSKDGRLLTFDDIVIDKKEFEKQVQEEHFPFVSEYSVEFVEADKKEIHERIKNNTLQFVMYYDGLEIHIPRLDPDGVSEPNGVDKIFISAFSHPEIFNMDYFTHVPEYYALHANYPLMGKSEIFWDFDGDGLVEALFMELGEKTSFTKATLHLDKSSIDLEIANCEYEYLTFVQADDGKYIYTDTYCVRIEPDGSLKKVSTVLGETGWMLSGLRHGQTPDHVIRECSGDIAGYRDLKREYTLLGAEGKTRPLTPYYYNTEYKYGSGAEVGRSHADVPAVLFDKNTGEDGEETVIPQGSTYVFCEYDPWNHMVLFCITPPGEAGHDKDYYAKVEFAPISHVGDLPKSGGLLAGISDDEIFVGLNHTN